MQDILDKSALQELVMRYFRAIDRRDFAQLRTLYHDDAIEDRGEIFYGTIDQFVAWLPHVTAQFELTVHRVFNTMFAVDGDYAEGELYAEAYHRTLQPDAKEMIAGGRYVDRYERRDGVWKFVYRTTTVDRCELRAVDQAAYQQFVAKTPPGKPDGSDLSYLKLKLKLFARTSS